MKRGFDMKKLLSIFLTIIIFISGTLCVSSNAVQLLILGDVSGDGVLSVQDVQSVLKYVSKGSALPVETSVLADFNFDGKIDKDDAYTILKCAAGIYDKQALEFTEWETTVEPTCTKEGSAQSVCKAKNLTRIKPLAKLPHSFIDGVCSVCGQGEKINGSIYVNSKAIEFYDSASTLVSTFGNPTEILNDTTSEGAVKHYVYAQNYSKLVIFTCSDEEGIIGVYTNDSTAILTLSENIKFSDMPEFEVVDDVCVYGYYDNIGTNAVHAFYAVVDDSTRRIDLTSNFTTQEKLIFHCVNASRAQNGKSALVYDTEIAKMALYHSKDMADNNYFDHTAPNGETFNDRLSKFSINCYAAAENIAAGIVTSAYHFNDAWYNSEGHRINMLGDYTHLGVGIAYNAYSDYLCYSTENFRSIS